MAQKAPWLRILGEGLAIIVSILLAFGIQAWWEARQTREEELEALQLLLSDLRADTLHFNTIERYAGLYNETARELMGQWDDSVADANAIGEAVGEFLRWSYIQLQNAGYLGLRDANRLGLIENDSLRTGAVRYFEQTQVALSQRADRLFSEREALMDLLSYHFRLWTDRNDDTGLITYAVLLSPWEDVQRDSRLYNQLSQMRSTSAPLLRLAEESRAANESLQALVVGEVEARW